MPSQPDHNVLFVDGEPRLLESISRQLDHRAQEWGMEFVSTPECVADALARTRFDVVVCDAHFRGHHGHASLLEQLASERHEGVRIALSSAAWADDRQATYHVAHRIVPKPFDGRCLERAIERSYKLKQIFDDPQLAQLLQRTKRLPSVPSQYAALTEALRSPDVGVDEIEAIITRDLALCAKLVQMTNSAYFGLSRRVTSVRHAIIYLGMRMIRQLVFSVEVFRSFPPQLADLIDPERIQRHATLTAKIAVELCEDERVRDEVFLAGMLHDIGKLVLASHLPDYFGPLLRRARDTARPLHEIEREAQHSYLDHASVGAFLVGRWGMPYSIAEAIAFHHRPFDIAQRGLELPALIHVADKLARELPIEPDLMDHLGLKHGLVRSWEVVAQACRATLAQDY